MKVNFCILVLGFISSAVMANDKFIPIPPLNSFGVNSGYSGMPQAPEPPAVPVDGSGAYKVPEFKMTESVSKKSNTKTEQKKSDVNEGLVAAGLLSSTGSLSGASSYLDTLLKNSYGNISGTDGNAGEKALLEEILKTLNSLENNKTENPGSRESAQDVKSSLPEILRLSVSSRIRYSYRVQSYNFFQPFGKGRFSDYRRQNLQCRFEYGVNRNFLYVVYKNLG